MSDLAAGGIVPFSSTIVMLGDGREDKFVPFATTGVPAEVLDAADELEHKLGKPAPHEKHSDWGSISSRLDEAMRQRLIDFGKRVV